jgi:uncharacterized protein (DUF1501 family)
MRHDHDIDRRRLLIGGALAAASLSSARARAQARLFASAPFALDAEPRGLLLVQLSGGNDGLSTVVPCGDDGYHAARKAIAHRAEDVLKIDDYRGLHPELGRMRAHYESGHLAIVEGAGYPDPTRSHFKSYEVWHTAQRTGRASGDGWIGRLCAAAWPENDDPNLVVHVGGKLPYSLYSSEHPAAAFATPTGYRWVGDAAEQEAHARAGMQSSEDGESNLDFLRKVVSDGRESSAAIRRAAAGYRPKAPYPADPFAASLRDVAALATAGIGSRVFSVELTGFDTHSNQKARHDQLMRRLDASLGAFLEDLHGTAAGRNLVVLVFSEFGRRVAENGSRGTDHGIAGPMFLAGEGVRGGLHGKHPSLSDLNDGDLVHTTDFRSVYATLIAKWLGLEPERVLGAEYPLLDLLA